MYCDNWLILSITLLDDFLLNVWNFLSRNLTTQSPRATMIPSATLMISSILAIPSAFSILAITGISAPCSQRRCLISSIHAAFLTNEAAIKSNPCSTPKMISSLSFSVMPGSLILTLGTLTPFLEPSSPPLITVH